MKTRVSVLIDVDLDIAMKYSPEVDVTISHDDGVLPRGVIVLAALTGMRTTLASMHDEHPEKVKRAVARLNEQIETAEPEVDI